MIDPTRIMALATSYWDSAVLLAANRLGIFDAVASDNSTVADIAAAINAPSRTTERLLDGCVGLGLLVKSYVGFEPQYENTETASVFLVSKSPASLSAAINWAADQYAAWGCLDEVVRAGMPAVDPADHLGDNPEQTRNFVLGMHQRAFGIARGVINFIDLEGVKSLLDIGGGPGTYSMLLAQRYPGLRSTVMDLPGVVSIAQELILSAGLSERVTVEPTDATAADYGLERCDGVLFSGVLHQMSAETCRLMIAGAFRALKPGGRLIVCDIMSDSSHTSPPFAALFSLQMLLTSSRGAVFGSEELSTWIQGSGYSDSSIQTLPPPLPYTVVAARKP